MPSWRGSSSSAPSAESFGGLCGGILHASSERAPDFDMLLPCGKRSPFALFCTDSTVPMLQIVAWYVSRWNIEVTFEEVRAHLGLETQRQWSTLAIARTTPCLLGLFSLVVLMAHALHPDHLPTRQAAWHPKAEPSFVDALATVRRHLWEQRNSPTSSAPLGSFNSSEGLLDTLIEIACYTA